MLAQAKSNYERRLRPPLGGDLLLLRQRGYLHHRERCSDWLARAGQVDRGHEAAQEQVNNDTFNAHGGFSSVGNIFFLMVEKRVKIFDWNIGGFF